MESYKIDESMLEKIKALGLPEKKESNEQKTQAPTGNNAAKKENIPLTGRAISLMKSAAKPKPVIMGAFAMLIITYVISVVRSKIKDKDVYP